jgi:hypothetical protein
LLDVSLAPEVQATRKVSSISRLSIPIVRFFFNDLPAWARPLPEKGRGDRPTCTPR